MGAIFLKTNPDKDFEVEALHWHAWFNYGIIPVKNVLLYATAYSSSFLVEQQQAHNVYIDTF